MKTKFSLLSFATAALLGTAAGLRAEDPVPPTPPVNPQPAVPAAVHPERGPGGPGGPGNRLDAMKEKLGLTPEQIEKIKPIVEKDREQLAALREDSALTREQKGEKMREILKSSMEAIKPILTPEQLEKWKAELETRKAEAAKRRAAAVAK